ncbi:MAG TPA: response regulator [Elusimicrobiota bacterium]|jgi:two-component system chemotaxis response regulator CheY|nr:response regulator [Elusimicrobiota bacterium]
MGREVRYLVLDAARACGVEPAILRSWLTRAGAEVSDSPGQLIGRRELIACLAARDLALPASLDPWPKILVVDDQSDVVRLIYWSLESAVPDAVVRCALSGAEALDLLAAFRPHLVVTDLRMPAGIDGFALCERIEADRSLFATKILVISGERDPQAWDRARARGAAECLPKPFTPERLAAAVRRLLELPEPSRLF